MTTRKHSLRVITPEETEAPKSIREELRDTMSDFLCAISLLEVLKRAVDYAGDDAELEASLAIVISLLHDAHNRLDLAGIRLSREGASSELKALERTAREAQEVRAVLTAAGGVLYSGLKRRF